jgi:hypothetical protein
LSVNYGYDEVGCNVSVMTLYGATEHICTAQNGAKSAQIALGVSTFIRICDMIGVDAEYEG